MDNDKKNSKPQQRQDDSITPNEALDMLRSACEYMRAAGLAVEAAEDGRDVVVRVRETHMTVTRISQKATFAAN